MNESREAFAGGLEVIKEAGKPGLATALHHHESQDEITDGFLLMSMCIRQNEADILFQASGQRVLCHRKPMLS